MAKQLLGRPIAVDHALPIEEYERVGGVLKKRSETDSLSLNFGSATSRRVTSIDRFTMRSFRSTQASV